MVVEGLTKTFKVPVREEGFLNSLKSLVNRTYRNVEAVRNMTFTLEPGEVVGALLAVTVISVATARHYWLYGVKNYSRASA